MTFEDILSGAMKEREELERTEKVRIFIGAATCGRAAGAKAINDVLEKELSERKIPAIVTQVGCIGTCYLEPLVDIKKPGSPRISYGDMTPKKMVELINDYVVNDNPRPDLALGIIGDGHVEGIPNFFELPMLKPQVRIILRNCGFIDPEKITHYIASGGYSGLVQRNILFAMLTKVIPVHL